MLSDDRHMDSDTKAQNYSLYVESYFGIQTYITCLNEDRNQCLQCRLHALPKFKQPFIKGMWREVQKSQNEVHRLKAAMTT